MKIKCFCAEEGSLIFRRDLTEWMNEWISLYSPWALRDSAPLIGICTKKKTDLRANKLFLSTRVDLARLIPKSLQQSRYERLKTRGKIFWNQCLPFFIVRYLLPYLMYLKMHVWPVGSTCYVEEKCTIPSFSAGCTFWWRDRKIKLFSRILRIMDPCAFSPDWR